MTRLLHLSRRGLLGAALSAGGLATGGATEPADDAVKLLPLPTRLYKVRDPGRNRTESWSCWLIVQTAKDEAVTLRELTLRLSAGESTVTTRQVSGAGLSPLVIDWPLPPRQPDGRAVPRPVFWRKAVRIRCVEPVGAAIDAMAIELALTHGQASSMVRVTLPVETYVNKTRLIWPFRGPGVITTAGSASGGHQNRSGQFALDGVGLSEDWGMYRPGMDQAAGAAYASWGRELIAPANGVIVQARADRPDQPDPENSDPAFFAPEYPDGGDPGNHLTIGHGQGEFSMLAHFQAGSMLVGVGDRVVQGQPLGKIGSSGDTVTPHCHYQLQDGPDWRWADGLPCVFSNVGMDLTRGSYFSAN